MNTVIAAVRTANVELSRVQDNVKSVVDPLAQMVSRTPIGGADLPPWTVATQLQGVTPIGAGFQRLSYYFDAVTQRLHLGGGFTTAGGLVGGDNFMLLPQEVRPGFNRALVGTALVGGVSTPFSFGVTPEGNLAVFNALAAGDSLIIDGASFRVGA